MLSAILSLLVVLPAAFAWCNDTSTNTTVNATEVSHRVVAYWGKFHEDDGGSGGPYLPLLPVIQNNSGITDLLLFVCDIHNNTPYLTVGGDAPDNTTWLPTAFWDDVHTLQENNVNVLASFGGYESNMFLLMEQDFDFYYPILRTFLKNYSLSGIDLDIEPSTNTLTSFAKGETILRLLKCLNRDFGSDFLISMAPVAVDLTGQYNPEFFSGFNYQIMDDMAVDEQGNHIVSWYNGQFYNGYGDCNSTAVYDQAVKYGGYDPSRIVWLVAADYIDASVWCNITELERVAGELAMNYTNLGGVGGYEYYYAGSSDDITPTEWYASMAAAIGNAVGA
ncbi:glycoside hydrolase superfamily [Kockovaella imperatae]|uniref:Glycoside hydrolase superfamily n=1 Tax=Kockovaella imperatae TaxID=4999 RepID=A0A1Y1UQR4_9TREE|nr:glycoside hydrolase superfamily [Kockovaella imperatae]ORX40329.1 glycoside hydrolase superfamily [Kockovaella imperatae]